jgi:pyrroline-5-carboxylate reductase
MNFVKNRKIGFLGAGNMAQAMIERWLSQNTFPKENLLVSNRSQGKLEKIRETYGLDIARHNEELLDKSDIVVVAVKPQDLAEALEPLGSVMRDDHIFVSLAAGVPLQKLRSYFIKGSVVRVMPNAPLRIGEGVLGVALEKSTRNLEGLMEDLFSPMGKVFFVDEGEAFQALTAACASGTGFVLELMIYWEDWLKEYGFSDEEVRTMVVKTFLGAARLAEESPDLMLERLQSLVVSKKGVTASGLQSMRSLEIERALRVSLEQAVMRDTQLSKS